MNRTRLLLIGFVALALGAIVSYTVYRTLQSRTGGDGLLESSGDGRQRHFSGSRG